MPNTAVSREYSYMTDSIGSGKRPKDCRHLIVKMDSTCTSALYGPFNGESEAGSQLDWWTQAHPYPQAARASLVEALAQDRTTDGSIPRVSLSWAQQDDRKVIQQLYDRARKPVVDGLLNLVESPEIPSALKSMVNHRDLYISKLDSYRSAVKKLSKAAANKYLAYSFGIAPLISDTQKIMSYLDKVKRDYERYRNREIRRVSITASGAFSFDNSPSSNRTYQGYATLWPTTRWVLTYRETNPYTTDFIGKLDFLLRRFGSAGPASFAWERIPFSFVLDWFIDTSSVIDYLDGKLQTDRIETLSLTRSNKAKITSDVFQTIRSFQGNVIFDQKLGSVSHSLYERFALAKSTYVDLDARFGKKQAALSVALLRQTLFKG